MAEPPFSSTTSPRHLPTPLCFIPSPTTSLPRQIQPQRPASPPSSPPHPSTPSPANPRPPLGYTVPGDEHDLEVIEEYKEGPLHRPVHGNEEEANQNHQIDAKADAKP